MRPSALMFGRYRAFKDEVRVELKRLNVVIGKNGGGKSLITRLPLLISGGLSGDSEHFLDLNFGGITHGYRYEDLVYQRSSQPFMLGLEISDGTNIISFKTTLRHIVEKYAFGAESFELTKNGETIIEFSAATPEDISSSNASFLVKDRKGNIITSSVKFAGLFPSFVSESEELSRQLAEYRDLFEISLKNPGYLGPFRSAEGSLARLPRQGVRTLGPKGELALDFLGDNSLRGDGVVADQVRKWFETFMYGNGVVIQMAGGIPRLMVHDNLRGVDVELSETGAGFAQVLPVVAQIYGIKSGLIKNSISMVEQPELHLHPAAHGPVADLFVELASQTSEVVQICETHSEQVITRIRRRIAERTLNASDVQLISIGHQADEGEEIEPIRSISFDKYGSPDAWPSGVFNEAFDDLVLLKAAASNLDRTKQEG
ncbi:AAA family ATPase [Rhizobium sp. PL01]|uniref:AAA family ATPase n=1 Tax=Rhizobium sp. PL01 TaxID=3085631 RepID=UPI002982B724|nr:AAA family ATPase [Rhizobium sp. PL01]MDW5315082.1 AAA family ATPase [Rhizobium sp. PL01]